MSKSSDWMDRRAFTRALDTMQAGLAFFDLSGRLVQANSAASTLFEGPDGDEIGAALKDLFDHLHRRIRERSAAADDRVEELTAGEVNAPGGRYSLRGSYIGLDLFGCGGTILITLERISGVPLSDEALRERFRLTRQEIRIARLLAEGKSNAEISAELHISPNTARIHTERILRKLGVRSRAAVGATLRSG